ncbi:hypothetical protein TOPH_00918 [Tolypocladium ophioglossoides CBS 100239]|uniref:Uncharacterized protein n=1 Tax=Tolypocladium ophioglossoides (strain CBS 100239) TaxID=1163406 RepID=A0A0L0NJP5_TOLOC|nr:hypothetical protein TOPH_00918 [Tolypocladium ophioglossoides CBS 100239]
MNPLATDFTPSTSPEPEVPQPEVLASRLPPADKHAASRPAAPVPVYDFGQQTAGPASSIYHFHPEIGYYHDFATAQRRNTPFPDTVPSQDGLATQWSQHQLFAEYHDTLDAHPFLPAVQAFARQDQNLELQRGPSHPTTENGGRGMDLMWPSLPPPRPAPGARQTVNGLSHVTEGQVNRDDAPKHSNNAGYQLHPDMEQSRSLPWHRRDIESPTPQVRVTTEHGFVGQRETRGTQIVFQPSRGREPTAVDTQQAPYLMIHPPIQSSSSAQGVLTTKQETQFLQVSGQARPLSGGRGERGRSARRSSRSERRRQSSHRGVGLLDERQSGGIEREANSSRSHPGLGDILESPYGYPSPQFQRRDAPATAWPSLAPIVAALRISPPAETSSSATMPTPAQITPAQTPNRMLSLAPVQKSLFTSAETPSSQANKRVDTQGNKPSSSSEQGQNYGFADPGLAPYDGADALQQRDERGPVGNAASTQYAAALSGPSDIPRHQPQSAAGSQQLNNSSPCTCGSQMTSPDRKSGQKPAETSSQPSRASAPAESGAWSQSKRWMSEEAKGRMSFARMMNNLRHIGADKSPAIPRSLTELAAFKAVVAEANRRELKRVVGQRLEELERRKDLTEEELKLADVKVEKLLWGKRPNDEFSPVLACRSCFNDPVPDEYERRVDWPSLAELKEEGEHRGGRYRRYFPLPRLNVIDPRVLATGQEEVYNPDGTIRWQMKAVKYDTTFLLPISPQLKATRLFADGLSHLPTMQSSSAGSRGCPSTCRHSVI